MNRKKYLVRLAFCPSRDNLKNRVVSGVAWQFGLMAFRVAITILSTAILVRMLTPDDYGLVVMSTIAAEIAALLANLGFGQILIQKEKITRLDLDSIFWASLALGCLLFLLLCLVAYPLSIFYGRSELYGILAVTGISFIVRSFQVVPSAILHRLMLFKVETIIAVVHLVLRVAIAIWFAWLGYGYWSLVLGPLIAGAIEVLINYIYVGFRPRLKMNLIFIKKNVRHNGSYLGSGVLNYVMSNMDYIIVGRRFGAEQLGYYQVAYSLPDELRNRLSGPLQKVLFPAFALIQNDIAAFQKGVFNSQRLLSVLVLPLGVGMALTAENIVKLLYGDKWLAVIPLLQILAINGSLRAMFSLVASIYYAKSRPDLAFKINLCSFPFVILCIFVGSIWGVQGVAYAMLFVMLPSFYALEIAMKLIDASSRMFYKACVPAVVSTLVMAAYLLVLNNFHVVFELLPDLGIVNMLLTNFALWYKELPVLLQLIYQVLTAAFCYLVFLAFAYREIYKELLFIILKKQKEKK